MTVLDRLSTFRLFDYDCAAATPDSDSIDGHRAGCLCGLP